MFSRHHEHELSLVDSGHRWTCDGCGKACAGQSWRCECCDFDFCSDCPSKEKLERDCDQSQRWEKFLVANLKDACYFFQLLVSGTKVELIKRLARCSVREYIENLTVKDLKDVCYHFKLKVDKSCKKADLVEMIWAKL